MNCSKSGNLICKGVYIGEEDLQKINTLTRRKFSAEELYCFRVLLCDNDIDRDMEQFDVQTLTQLSNLFLGKTGICDHEPKSQNQMARIYDVSVENFPGKVNALGEPYYALIAKAYMVRTEANRDQILEIEAGIKKEVSVGCAMGRSVCSICGSDYGSCGHRKGESYDGQVCCAILQEPMDAYEFSFVAVPAQREAGVLKGLGCGKPKLKELADEFGVQAEYRALYQQAELGKRYQKELEDSIVRLGLSLELGVEAPVLRSIAKTAAAEDLIKLKSALEERLAESMPLTTQLGSCRGKEEKVESGFLI